MEKQLIRWEIAGFFFTAAVGMLLHFAYAWSGGNRVLAAFSAVNESVWEHMKLLAVPVFLFSVVQACWNGKRFPNLLAVQGISALAGVLLIPMLFYTYTGMIGRNVMWVDIAIFFLADAAVFLMEFLLLRRGAFSAGWQQFLGLLLLWGLLFLFVWCTYRPPQLPLWRDSQSLSYGIFR